MQAPTKGKKNIKILGHLQFEREDFVQNKNIMN